MSPTQSVKQAASFHDWIRTGGIVGSLFFTGAVLVQTIYQHTTDIAALNAALIDLTKTVTSQAITNAEQSRDLVALRERIDRLDRDLRRN